MKNTKITIVAGSFGYFHRGHKLLLRAAMETKNHVIVGLTSDIYGSKTKHYDFPAFEERKSKIEQFLSGIGSDYEIKELSDNTGDSTNNPDYEIIVVSRETEKNAMIINEKRRQNGIAEMKIIPVDLEIADDFFPISSRRIERGEIDQDGKRLKPIRVSICSNIAIRKDLYQNALSGVFNNEFSITGFVTFKEGNELKPEDILLDNDFSMCVSYEIKYDYKSSLHLFTLRCTILDRYGNATVGYGPAMILNEEMYHTFIIKDIDRTDHIIEGFGDQIAGNILYESIKMSMEPRKKPWAYGLMDYFKDQD